MNGLIGKKLGMTQVFDEVLGRQVPVTAIELGPCAVVQRKTAEADGYDAVQIGFADQKEHRVRKPRAGHFKKAGVAPKRHLREFRLEAGDDELSVGDALTAAVVFEGVSHVDIIGTTKGRGFQGVVKRYNMGGGRASHGADNHRRVGSIGQCISPARVIKGRKMPGQMGNTRITTQNIKVQGLLAEDHILLVRGAVPGPEGAVVIVHKSLKKSTAVS